MGSLKASYGPDEIDYTRLELIESKESQNTLKIYENLWNLI